MHEDDKQYEVGYGKPPEKGQFTKGVSGNPKGRPKGSKNLANVVLKESRQLVRINGPHGTRNVTKLEAAMMQLGNKSAQGDLRAVRDFAALVGRSEESAQAIGNIGKIEELDQRMMQSLRRRFEGVQTDNDQPTKEENQ